eukprot:13768447-Alexandrium_andersonii.AAC.1
MGKAVSRGALSERSRPCCLPTQRKSPHVRTRSASFASSSNAHRRGRRPLGGGSEAPRKSLSEE